MKRHLPAAIVLLSLSVQAVAAEPVCVTREESDAVFMATLPGIVDNLRARCENTLPADAPLIARGVAASERYAVDAANARPLAAAALERAFTSGADALPPGISGERFLGMFEAGMGAELLSNMRTEDCAAANDIFEAVEPLPAANLARITSIFMQLGTRNDEPGANAPPFRIC